MRNVQDDYRLAVQVDPVTHAPGRSAEGGRLPGVFVTQRMADTARVVQQGAGDELRRGSSDLLRQPGELALRPETHIELTGPLGRSRGAGVAEQVRKAAAKSGLIEAWAILPRPGSSPEAARSAATPRHHAVDSVNSSPCSRCHSSADTSTTGW